MTEQQIKKQIEVIHRATAKAMVSKEAATQFLLEAGIITEETPKPKKRKSKK